MNMKIKMEETHEEMRLYFACLTPSVISESLEQTSISPDKQIEYINKKRFCSHFLNGHQFIPQAFGRIINQLS